MLATGSSWPAEVLMLLPNVQRSCPSMTHLSCTSCRACLVNSVVMKTGGLESTSVSLYHLVELRQMLSICWEFHKGNEILLHGLVGMVFAKG